MRKLDLTGQRYGKLTVIELDADAENRSWLCKCDCGGKKVVKQDYLRRGTTTSCGCLQHYDLTGMTFGDLSVIGRNEERDGRGRPLWHCHCSCGGTKNAETSDLLQGNTKSCGCLKIRTAKKMKEIQESQNIDGIQVSSLKRKVNKNSKTGTKGVVYRKNHKKPYNAKISINKKRIWLGSFYTLEEAIQARKEGEKMYHQPYLNKIHNNE